MKNRRWIAGEEGTALVATLILLMAMSVLSTALVFTVQNEMKTSSSYKYGQQAFYVADAGVRKAIQWFGDGSNYTPAVGVYPDLSTVPITYSSQPVRLAGQGANFPVSGVVSSFTSAFHDVALQADGQNSGTYSVGATLLKYSPASFINMATFETYPSAMERWRIESTGTWGNPNTPLGRAEITAVIENSGNALFDRALWGIDSLDLGGTVLIDSYDPALGPYGGTNIGDNGAIGSNGAITINGTVEVHGDAAYGPDGSFGAPDGAVTGDIIQLPAPRTFPPIPEFTVGTGSTTVSNKKTVTLSPGQYGDINVKSGGTLALEPGVYYFDSIIAKGEVRLTGDLTKPTTIFVKSALDLGAQGITNPNGDPTRLNIFYSGTSEMKIHGGPEAFVEVYAPNAPLKMVGNSAFYGSFIGRSVTVQGTPDVHFDEGCLQENLIQRPFRLMTWSRNLYQ